MSPSSTRRATVLRRVLYLLCFLSGICGLAYQVIWVRELTLILGVTTYAIATVLASFMGGLALGSYAFGRLALRVRSTLGLYGLLEVAIGVSALLLPFGFEALTRVYSAFYTNFAAHGALFSLGRFLVLAALLAVPCSLMGGTISVLSKLQSRSTESFGRDIGLLYALNTLGAVVGCLLAGFILIAEVGLRATSQLAAAANIGIGVASFMLQRATAGSPGAPPAPAPGTTARVRSRFANVVLVVFAVSGFCSLGYEVLWTRTLVFYLHNSTYAFTTMLSCFLLGIGLGSLLPIRAVDAARRPALLLALAQLGIGAATIVALRSYPSLPGVVEALQTLTSIDAWWKALAVQGTQAVIILLPATFLMGLCFPVAVRLYAAAVSTVSRDVGVLYAWNTLGAIAGSLFMGFLCLPTLGLIGSFRLLIAINLLTGLLVLLADPEASRRVRRGAAVATLFVPLLVWRVIPGSVFTDAFRDDLVILFYKDGVADTVMVKSAGPESRRRALFFSDGRGTAGTMTNAQNRIYGHLPLLLHGNATEVLSIAFGVGNTLAAIVVHPEVTSVDVVELSPNVLEAAPYFPTNDRVYDNPKVTVHIQDGRNYLLGVPKLYDVIQLEPPEIHTAGVVFLYTREFYALARQRLKPGGLLCQWANVNMMPLREQKMLIRTFLEVFPHGTVWTPRNNPDYVLLIAGERPLAIDYQAFQRAFKVRAVRQDLKRAAGILVPAQLLAGFRLSPDGARAFTAGVPIISDDRTYVDFSVPRSVDANYGLTNAFSGITVNALINGGWPATRDYYVSKMEVLRTSVESVFPLLGNFESERQRLSVQRSLEFETLRFDRAMRLRIENMASRQRPISNY